VSNTHIERFEICVGATQSCLADVSCREHVSTCSEAEASEELWDEPQRVYRWQGHVIVVGRRGDWKCPVEGCDRREVIESWEELRSHVLTHGCSISRGCSMSKVDSNSPLRVVEDA
jgi:hypothetical protein